MLKMTHGYPEIHIYWAPTVYLALHTPLGPQIVLAGPDLAKDSMRWTTCPELAFKPAFGSDS